MGPRRHVQENGKRICSIVVASAIALLTSEDVLHLEHLECRLQPLPPGRFAKKLG